jgi:hypothetical protein
MQIRKALRDSVDQPRDRRTRDGVANTHMNSVAEGNMSQIRTVNIDASRVRKFLRVTVGHRQHRIYGHAAADELATDLHVFHRKTHHQCHR